MSSNFILSPNMGLTVPVTGVDPGPDYANLLNACQFIIDNHNHSSGSGVQIGPSGLAINSDLPFGSNNATLLRSVRFTPQSAVLGGAADLGCLYEVAADLYFNDGNGNKVRITQSGGVAGSPGSIANLTSPASASYVSASSTFVWQSAANTPANLDAASILLRNLVANSHSLTLSPPNSLASNYTLVLPALPSVSGNILTCDTSGNITANLNVDGATLQSVSNFLSVKNGGINNAQIGAQAVAQNQLAARAVGQSIGAGGVALSPSCGTFSTTSSTPTNVTNLGVTLTTTGRPVFIGIQADGAGNNSFMEAISPSPNITANAIFTLFDGTSNIANYPVFTQSNSNPGNSTVAAAVPVSSFWYLDFPAATTKSYTVRASVSLGSTATIAFAKLIAYEI